MRTPRLSRRRLLVSLTLVGVLAASGLGAILFPAAVQAHSSTITVIDGEVLVRHGAAAFAPPVDGESVTAGDTVRTGAASHAVLTLFDGSTVELEPATELTVSELQATASGDKLVILTQVIGRTWHAVAHLVSPRSHYEVTNGSAVAAVRGTAFEVNVATDGTFTTRTTEGDVSTSAQGVEVHVLRGQTSSVRPGAPPTPPEPAAEPPVTVRVIVDAARTALVRDPLGRAVGVLDGLPVRYVPGSSVERVGDRLVLTVPAAELGPISTTLRPDDASAGTARVQVQVLLAGRGVVANTLAARPIVGGVAKDAVLLTADGLILVPDADAMRAPLPRVGARPEAPGGPLSALLAPAPAAVPSATAGPADTVASTSAVPLALPAAAAVPFTATAGAVAPNAGVTILAAPLAPVFAPSAAPASGAPRAVPTAAGFVPPPGAFGATIPPLGGATAGPAAPAGTPSTPPATTTLAPVGSPALASPSLAPFPSSAPSLSPLPSVGPSLASPTLAATPSPLPTPTVGPLPLPTLAPLPSPTIAAPPTPTLAPPPTPTIAPPTTLPSVAPSPSPTARICIPLVTC